MFKKTLYSLTFSQLSSLLTNREKPLVFMDLLELLRNVHDCEDRASPFDMISASPLSQRQTGLAVAMALRGKTVDQLWREIGLARCNERLGEITLEEFLAQVILFAEPTVPTASSSHQFTEVRRFDSSNTVMPQSNSHIGTSSSSPSIGTSQMQERFTDQFGGLTSSPSISASQMGFDSFDYQTQNHLDQSASSSSSLLISESQMLLDSNDVVMAPSYWHQFGGSSSSPSIGTKKMRFDSNNMVTPQRFQHQFGGFSSINTSQMRFDSSDTIPLQSYSHQLAGSLSPSIGTTPMRFDSKNMTTPQSFPHTSSSPSIGTEKMRFDSNNMVTPRRFQHQFGGFSSINTSQMRFDSSDTIPLQSYSQQFTGSSPSPSIAASQMGLDSTGSVLLQNSPYYFGDSSLQMRLSSTNTVPLQSSSHRSGGRSLPSLFNASEMRLDLTDSVMQPQSNWLPFASSSSAPSIGTSQIRLSSTNAVQPQSSSYRYEGLPPFSPSIGPLQIQSNHEMPQSFSHQSEGPSSSQQMNVNKMQPRKTDQVIKKRNPVTMMKNRESAERSRARKRAYVASLEQQIEEEKQKFIKLLDEAVFDQQKKPVPKLRRTGSF